MQNQQILKSISAYLAGSGEFDGLGVENLHNNYKWKFHDWPEFFTLQPPDADDFTKNICLKENSAQLWQTSDKYQCAKWIVASWGGVRRNKPEKIKRYVDTFQSGGAIVEKEGVASYSKILAFMQPTEFAIFDARVSAALNCIQLLDATKDPIFFLPLPARNKDVLSFRKNPKEGLNRSFFLRRSSHGGIFRGRRCGFCLLSLTLSYFFVALMPFVRLFLHNRRTMTY